MNFIFIYRAEARLWSPQVTEDGKAHPFKINLESEPQVWILELNDVHIMKRSILR